LLQQLEIDSVVHGHRPQRSGVQVDNEFYGFIPNIRMIGNDTQIRANGIGATLIRMDIGRKMEVLFVNSKVSAKKIQGKMRRLLRKSTPKSALVDQQQTQLSYYKNVSHKLETEKESLGDSLANTRQELEEQKSTNLLLEEKLSELDTQKSTANQLQIELNRTTTKLQEYETKRNIERAKTENSKTNDREEIISLQNQIDVLSKQLEQSEETKKQAINQLRIGENKHQELENELSLARQKTSFEYHDQPFHVQLKTMASYLQSSFTSNNFLNLKKLKLMPLSSGLAAFALIFAVYYF